MSRIPQIDPATATGRIATQLQETEKALGSIPNLFKVMVTSPAAVAGYLGMNSALGSGVLPLAVRERIAVATAEFNGCSYCLSAHTFSGRKFAKISEEELDAAREAKSEDPYIQALLTLALTVLRERGDGGQAAIQAARAAGLDDAEIIEVVANVALNVMTNYFNNLVDTDIDFPQVTPHQH
jgi:uncharacterized peroxidase-related enzyme